MRRTVEWILVGAIVLDVAYWSIWFTDRDLLYDLEHGIFAKGSGGVVEAGIVAVTLVLSVTVLRFAWGSREELLHPAS